MNISKRYIRYFELLLTLIIILILFLHNSDTKINERSFLFDRYSENYFYFVLIYIFFFILLLFEKIKNKIRFVILFLNLLYLNNIFKNQSVENIFANNSLDRVILLLLIIISTLSFFILNFKYILKKLQLIKNYNFRKKISFFLNINIKDLFKYSFVLFIIILIVEIFLHFLLPKNFTNLISNKIYGNYFYDFPYRHESYQYIGVGMKSNLKLKYTHYTKSGKSYLINYSTNNKGLRIPFNVNFSKKYLKENNEKVILITGGSTAFGVGSSDDDTISSLLEKKLNNFFSNYKFTVLNLGIGAANSYQEFLALDLYGKNFDPDWVISLTGRNDGYNSLVTNNGTGFTSGFKLIKKIVDGLYFNQPKPKIHFSNIENFLSKYSILYRISTGSSHIDKEAKKKDIKFEETFDTINFFLKSLKNIISSDNSIKYIISNQPYYELIINGNFENVDQLSKFENENKNKNHKEIDKLLWMEYWNAKSSHETKKLVNGIDNVFYVNFNKEFLMIKNLNDIFIDSSHLTKDGNNIIAQKYFEIIVKNYK